MRIEMGMSLYEALEDSAFPDLITPRRYLVTDNVPDKGRKLSVLYRYRVELWDEGYKHYRSVIFADTFSALAIPLSPASTMGDWQPVLTNNEEE
jgi:hypothetical protein